jgi:hypothetical protein
MAIAPRARHLRAVGVVLMLGLLTGCSSSPATLPVPTTTAAGEATPTVEPTPEQVDAGFTTKNILVGPVAGEGLNERATLIAGDMSDLLVGASIDTEAKDLFTDEQMVEMNQVAATFAIENIIDSDYLHTDAKDTAQRWVEDVTPYVTKDVAKALQHTAGQPVPDNTGAWRGYPDPERPTASGTYFDDVKLTLRRVATNEGLLFFVYGVDTQRAVVNEYDRADKAQYDEHMRMKLTIGIGPDGKHKVGGLETSRSTRTVKQGEKPDFSDAEGLD